MVGILQPDGIFYPLALHLALLLLLYVMVSVKRMQAVREKTSRQNDFAWKDREPETSRRWSNNLNNQFELPLMFYALIALVVAKGQVSVVYTLLAWVFVIGRYIHCAVQVSSDNVRLRGMVFVINFLALALMWLYFLQANLLTHE